MIWLTALVTLALFAYLLAAFLHPAGKVLMRPTTIFNAACSFLTNANLHHYSGEVHLSYFSQLFFICWKQFFTPAIGLAALLAIIRGLRGDKDLGNFYLDVWRGTIYVMLPLAVLVGLLLMAGGGGGAPACTAPPPGRWGGERHERGGP